MIIVNRKNKNVYLSLIKNYWKQNNRKCVRRNGISVITSLANK